MMNYDIHIENLGAIEEADITITPLTILAGENGTGKSFVTKFLYSVLSTLNVDTYSNHTLNIIKKLNTVIDQIIKHLVNNKDNLSDINSIEFLKNLISTFQGLADLIVQSETDYYEVDNKILIEVQDLLLNYRDNVLPDLYDIIDNLRNKLDTNQSKGFLSFSTKRVGGFITPKTLLDRTLPLLNELFDLLKNPQLSYLRTLSDYITNELKENFQISEIQHLINYSANESIFEINDLMTIKINREDGLNIKIQSELLFSHEKINHILFFESPVYWRLLPIIDDLDELKFRGLAYSNRYEVLTGIPKYFYDLKNLLFTNFKEGERPSFIVSCANELKQYLKGSFKTSDSDITFENNNGQSISKNLVSFGMTNLGIFQAVLSKNIINKGSFVFIDEPESNLHPEWQAILANVLVELAKNGVYVIVTTHSSDMLKAFEISTQEQEVSEELSTYYFQTDGTLLAMDDKDLSPIEQARKKLLETYENLMIRGYLL